MSTPGTPPTGASEQEAPVCYRHTDREAHIRCQRCDRRICPDCMRPAAVGFQCPGCVQEGSRQTRSGRTAYGGRRSGNPALTSQVLIGINVVVWLAIVSTGWRRSPLVDYLALLPRGGLFNTGGGQVQQIDGVADGAAWQLVTSMFTHVELAHIGFNMLALWVLGPQLELALGRTRFLVLYFVSGLAGSAMVMWFAQPYQATLGASGAIFGLMGGLLVVALKVGGDVRGLLTWIGINFVFTFLFIGRISWQGHVGGLVGGMLVAAVLVYAPRQRRTLWQVAGVVLVVMLVAVASATRVLVLT